MTDDPANTDDEVLVKPNGHGGTYIYHLPDPDTPSEPKCGRHTDTRSAFRTKPRGLLPADARACKRCRGIVSHGGRQGPKLSAKLEEIGRERAGGETA